MKNYTIIGGVNGVGKSSLTGVLKSRMTDLGIIVDVDKMTAQAGGSVLQGGKRAVRLIEDCIAKNVSFTQETTLSGHRIRQTARRVRDAGYAVRLFYVGLDTAGESLRRIANRQTWSAASSTAGRLWRTSCPTVMRRSFMTTTTALRGWRPTATGSWCWRGTTGPAGSSSWRRR